MGAEDKAAAAVERVESEEDGGGGGGGGGDRSRPWQTGGERSRCRVGI